MALLGALLEIVSLVIFGFVGNNQQAVGVWIIKEHVGWFSGLSFDELVV